MSSSVGVGAGGENLAPPSASPVRNSESAERLELSELERRHLDRVLRNERLFPAFLRANLGIAAALAIYYSWSGSWTGIRAVLVLLILLSARAHLRQLRSARLLRKLSRSETRSQ